MRYKPVSSSFHYRHVVSLTSVEVRGELLKRHKLHYYHRFSALYLYYICVNTQVAYIADSEFLLF